MSHDRLNERLKIGVQLERGASLLMLAPRRLGKTWLMRKVRDDLEEKNWLCVLVNVEGKRTEDEFLRELCGEIEKKQDVASRLLGHITQRFKQVTLEGRGSIQDAIGSVDPRGLLEVLVSALSKEERRTLILIDEIALFVLERAKQDPSGTLSLLHHLRKLQQSYPKVQWFLTGSVGLDVVARRYHMAGSLLEYDSVDLRPFDRAESLEFIKHMQSTGSVDSFEFLDDAFNEFVDKIGWLSPFYLRHVSRLIEPTGKGQPDGRYASSDDVERAVRRILEPDHRYLFSAWEEHIEKNFDAVDTELLHALLDILCESHDGEVEATLLTRIATGGLQATPRKVRGLLIDLGADGYVATKSDRWAFRSGLLRRFWLEYVKQ